MHLQMDATCDAIHAPLPNASGYVLRIGSQLENVVTPASRGVSSLILRRSTVVASAVRMTFSGDTGKAEIVLLILPHPATVAVTM